MFAGPCCVQAGNWSDTIGVLPTIPKARNRPVAQTRSHDIDMLHGPLVPKIIAYALPVAASDVL